MRHQTIKRQSIQSEELRPSRGIAKIGRKGLFQQGPGYGRDVSPSLNKPEADNGHNE
jgi:hypothetical protein